MKIRTIVYPLVLASFTMLVGCGTSDSENTAETGGETLSLSLQLPDSLTGGREVAARTLADGIEGAALAAREGTGEPCAFVGVEEESDLFENGYQTTRFMVSLMATWTCIADFLIDVADVLVHDGSIVEGDNDTLSPDYDADDPTHYSVTDDSDMQTTIRMYYGYDRANPPTEDAVPEFYLSWYESDAGAIQGKMIIDASLIDAEDRNPEDPVRMRMDFDFDDQRKLADVFMQFDASNPWADGMRIDIRKDLQANLFSQVYTARGMIEMKGQFFEVDTISEIPDVQFYTVADGLGNGAALEEIQDMSLPIWINPFRDNYLGNYLFTKQDVYFFEDDMDWDYINKTVTSAVYRGGRTTAASGGTWIPFNPSLDMVINALVLDSDYFTGDKCAAIDDECTELLNAVFVDGFADQEQNQGTDPMDWRSDALADAVFLDSVYPNGQNWEGAFDQVFDPVL